MPTNYNQYQVPQTITMFTVHGEEGANANRVMMVVTIERADGRQIMRESIGAFPDMTPTPEPEEVSEEN